MIFSSYFHILLAFGFCFLGVWGSLCALGRTSPRSPITQADFRRARYHLIKRSFLRDLWHVHRRALGSRLTQSEPACSPRTLARPKNREPLPRMSSFVCKLISIVTSKVGFWKNGLAWMRRDEAAITMQVRKTIGKDSKQPSGARISAMSGNLHTSPKSKVDRSTRAVSPDTERSSPKAENSGRRFRQPSLPSSKNIMRRRNSEPSVSLLNDDLAEESPTQMYVSKDGRSLWSSDSWISERNMNRFEKSPTNENLYYDNSHHCKRSQVRGETWMDFHSRHHSRDYHFSCRNERLFDRSPRRRRPGILNKWTRVARNSMSISKRNRVTTKSTNDSVRGEVQVERRHSMTYAM